MQNKIKSKKADFLTTTQEQLTCVLGSTNLGVLHQFQLLGHLLHASKTDMTPPVCMRYGLAFTALPALQVDISHTGGVGSGRNTKTALEIKYQDQMAQ